MKEVRSKCTGSSDKAFNKEASGGARSAGPPGTPYDLEFHPRLLLGFRTERKRKTEPGQARPNDHGEIGEHCDLSFEERGEKMVERSDTI